MVNKTGLPYYTKFKPKLQIGWRFKCKRKIILKFEEKYLGKSTCNNLWFGEISLTENQETVHKIKDRYIRPYTNNSVGFVKRYSKLISINMSGKMCYYILKKGLLSMQRALTNRWDKTNRWIENCAKDTNEKFTSE